MTALILLAGCAFGVGGIDDTGFEKLLSPPRLTAEQTAIHNAIVASKGENGFSLKYPRSGEYRSAFVVRNLDSEPEDEALVFCETPAVGDSPAAMWLVFLDKDEGEWRAISDLSLPGMDVERLSFAYLGEQEHSDGSLNGAVSIIVGYLDMTGEKTALVLNYEQGVITKLISRPYTYMNTEHYFDAENLLMIISCDRLLETADAAFYSVSGGQLKSVGGAAIDGQASEITHVSTGLIKAGTPAVFINYHIGQGDQYGTNALYWATGRLINPILQTHAVTQTVRQPNALTELANPMDINGDGITEFCATATFPGYSTFDAAGRMRMTIWKTFERGQLNDIYYSYYSERGAFIFFIPSRWRQIVTARLTIDGGGVEFLIATGNAADADKMLFSIRAVGTGEPALPEGWRYLAANPDGEIKYYLEVTKSNDDDIMALMLTLDELRDCFRMITASGEIALMD